MNTGTEVATETKKSIEEIAMDASKSGGGFSISPENLGEVVRFADAMARGGVALPKHLRGEAGACMAIAMQAFQWEMNPFSVASKSYFVNDRVAYEAQLITAVINTRSGIKGRLKYEYEGSGQSRKCTVTGVIDDEILTYETPEVGQIGVKNSPLWKSDPDQQLAYYGGRGWGRRHTPEVLLGVYTQEEAQEFKGPDNAKDVSEAAARYSKPVEKQVEEKPEIEDAEVIQPEDDVVETPAEDLFKEQPDSGEVPQSQTTKSSASGSTATTSMETGAEQPKTDPLTPMEKAKPDIIEMFRLMMTAIDKRGSTSFVAVRESISHHFDNMKKIVKAETYPKDVMDLAEELLDIAMDYCSFNQDETTGKPLKDISAIAAAHLGISEDELLEALYETKKSK